MARKKKARSTAPAPQPAPRAGLPFVRYSLVLLMAAVVALSWLSLLTFSPHDPPSRGVDHPHEMHNAAGVVGAHIAHFLRYWVGAGAYVGLALLSLATLWLMALRRIRHWPWRLAGSILLVMTSAGGSYLLYPPPMGDPVAGRAGIIGASVGDFVSRSFGDVGGWVVLGVACAIGVLFTGDSIVQRLWRGVRHLWSRRRDLREAAKVLAAPAPAKAAAQAPVRPARPAEPAPRRVTQAPAPRPTPAPVPVRVPRERGPSLVGRLLRRLRSRRKVAPQAAPIGPPAASGPQAPVFARVKVELRQQTPPAEAPSAPRPAVQAPAPPKAPVRKASPSQAPAASAARDAELAAAATNWSLPEPELLSAPTRGYTQSQEGVAAQKRATLQQTLTDFNVEAQVVGYMTGPVITLFELALAPGVKVARVANLADDIARALAVPAVRIFAPIPGKDTVGVEVPNMEKETVRIRELMDVAADARDKQALPLYLGKDAGGDPIVSDLAAMPHLLIAGTTGSGKSVCINAIIMSLLLTRSPEEVKFILVDPKMVEMAAFENIPHLLCPIVNDMRKAEEILDWAATKMDERYELLKEARVRNIKEYNQLRREEILERFEIESEEELGRIPLKLPYYVIIIDELADLMMTSSKEVEGYIIRIAQKARAVGIHLVLATQRPSVNVVTGLIKSNMPCRISFRVASRQESRIVLDQNGAEVLLGQGDMLFLKPGTSNLARAQGTFLDDNEIRKVVKALRKSSPSTQYNAELMRLQSRPTGDIGDEKDDLFDKAVEIVLSTSRGSVSLLQRRLQVGYSRASRIIDQMAAAGLLGEYKGSQARECLITLDDWEAMKAARAADLTGESSANGEPTSA